MLNGKLACVAIIAVVTAACGGTQDNASDKTTTGTLIADEKLCELVMGTTTKSEALARLGPPETQFDTGEASFVTYAYQKDGNLNMTDSVLTTLQFNRAGVLTNVSKKGAALPACLGRTDGGA